MSAANVREDREPDFDNFLPFKEYPALEDLRLSLGVALYEIKKNSPPPRKNSRIVHSILGHTGFRSRSILQFQ